jgi:SSS family solute:Na+ symporter
MIGFALHQKGAMRIPTGPNGEILGDMVFPTMVASLLPVGLRGLVVGGLMSALMSSLASLFNSCATLFTVDIYEKLRPGRPEQQLVRVGRMATVVVVALGLLWIPIMKAIAEGGGGLYDYLQNVQGFLAPPIVAVFLLGLFNRRINATGALWGLLLGVALGMVKLTLQTLVQSGALARTGVLGALGGFNGYYFTGVLFVVSVLLVVGISYATAAPAPERITGLTYWSTTPEQRAERRASVGTADVVATVAVLALLVVIYLYFSTWI